MNKTLIRKCFACKQSIDLFDEKLDLNSLIYDDGKFYHKDCYTKMNEVKKKCCQCKKDIVYSYDKKDTGVFYDDHYYHEDCFERWCVSTKRISPKRKFALENKQMYLDKYNERMSFLLKSKVKKDINKLNQDAIKAIYRHRDESDFNDYIKKTYNVETISTDLWRRLEAVYKGTYKGLDKPIPVEHLSNMWKSKQSVLDDINQRNILKGKKLDNECRIVYDLAVLISKYESYLSSLNKKRIVNSNEENLKELMLSAQIIKSSADKKKYYENDLSTEVDEIFG